MKVRGDRRAGTTEETMPIRCFSGYAANCVHSWAGCDERERFGHETELPLSVCLRLREVERRRANRIRCALAMCASCAAQMREEQESKRVGKRVSTAASSSIPPGTLLAHAAENYLLLDDFGAAIARAMEPVWMGAHGWLWRTGMERGGSGGGGNG